jgi:hypothetical protein
VRAPERASLDRLAGRARDTGLLAALNAQLHDPAAPRLEGRLASRYAGELPPMLRDTEPDTIIGPYADHCEWSVAQVYARQAAKLEGPTRAAVEEAVCREWLAEQRAAAQICWHWL